MSSLLKWRKREDELETGQEHRAELPSSPGWQCTLVVTGRRTAFGGQSFLSLSLARSLMMAG